MRAIVVATVAAVALVGLYLGLGGASYAPAAVADPCAPRDWRNPGGFQEVAEQIVLSGLDGAACKLDVSREQIVLAFANGNSLAQFARDQGISETQFEELLRTGFVRAIDDAERANALNATVASLLRQAVQRVPVDTILELLKQLPNF
jgi:hypothetical protein